MSSLADHVHDYLQVRRAMGFKLEDHGRLLPQFAAFVQQRGEATVTIAAAVEFSMLPDDVQPFRWRQRLTVIRGFAGYLAGFDPATEIPPCGLLGYRPQRPTPFLFSQDDIDRLVAAAGTLRHPLIAATHQTLFGLLAVTGMRVGEALRLDHDAVDLEAGTVDIVRTKFNKSRRIPVHPSTIAALRDYCDRRDRLCPRPKHPAFFVSTVGTRLGDRRVRAVFVDLIDSMRMKPRTGCRAPRIHDLRHSFAVATLVGWYRSAADVAVLMPLLSAYLGHVNPASTYWYLQASPELLALAAQRLGPLGQEPR
jgi:integrase